MTAPTFSRRAKVRRTELSHQRAYLSECGRWKLIDVRSLVGLGRYWLLVRRCECAGEFVASRNRTRPAAERALNRLLRQSSLLSD